MSEYKNFSSGKNKGFGYQLCKRFFDLFLTIVFFPIIFLIIIIFAIVIKIDSEGPAFYSQDRLGLNGKEFKVIKLRSMKVNAEASTGAVWAGKNDPRITKVGKFIRKTRVDELPQFFNVLLGQMSIVGPRPERKVFSDEFVKTIPNFEDRLSVKPGLTGLAQVSGGYEMSPSEKLTLDLEYINNFSFKQDLKIFFKTFGVLLTGDGAR
ncbi:MAG: sugar transferase [Erysipelothrix sp.]